MELQYDGTGLHGWAKQEGLTTVEGCLEEAFCTVLGEAPALRVAGRTDAGVHARRQVVSLRLPQGADLPKLAASLNALTPSGIVISRIARASEGFDARKNAVSRTYRYFLVTTGSGAACTPVSPFWSKYCWQTGRTLDPCLLGAAAEATTGRHDFTAFTPAETGHVFFRRLVLRCAWRRTSGTLAELCGGRGGGGVRAGKGGHGRGLLCLEIEADAFLRHMVRALVGTMVEVGEGKRGLDGYRRLLKGAARETGGPTAPAHGLFLWNVRYGTGVRAGEGEGIE